MRGLMKQIPKEWLVLIIIAVLVIGISLFEWNKTSPQNQKRDKDTSDGVLSEVEGTPPRWSNQKATRKEKEENNVTVIIEYLPDQPQSSLIFRIALDTHSVNLDAFDFGNDITLEKDGKSFSPTLLKQEGGGHHRSAEVNFPTTDTPFTIIVKNLSNIPKREFYFEKL